MRLFKLLKFAADKMKSVFGSSILIFLFLQNEAKASNILFLYPVATKSETHLFLPIAEALAAKNHSITLVSPVHTAKLPSNIHQVVATKPMADLDFFLTSNVISERELAKSPFTYYSSFNFSVFADRCHAVFKNEEFKKLYKQSFDLILISALVNECMEGLVYKFQAPYVIFSSMPAGAWVIGRTGFLPPPSFIPVPFIEFTHQMSFTDRFSNTLMTWLLTYLFTTANSDHEKVYRTYLGQDFPAIHEIEKNLSMIFTNTHFSINFPRPALPDTIEIGGIHCRPAKPLPKDLNDFISGAEHGVILFSLGSVVQTKTLPEKQRKIFVNVLSKLKQKVLWKWDTEEMNDLPPNVKLVKWLPQQDILGHPNVKLFISHGGLLSTQESVYHGVPMLGIPLFVDQDVNVNYAQDNGFALMVEILEMTEENLGHKIKRMLTEPSFGKAAKKMSAIFKDGLNSPIERATYWLEYVVRHKGAPHMRSPARDLNFYQYHSIDVVAVVGIILGSIFAAIILVVRWLCCRSDKKLEKAQSSQRKKKN